MLFLIVFNKKLSMDKTTVKELLDFIIQSLNLIKRRFDPISKSDDFFDTDDGIDRLDAISMRLQSIGKKIKNLDKREREFLLRVADRTYWSQIIRTREILTHHYIDIDAEVIYMICDDKLQELEEKILSSIF